MRRFIGRVGLTTLGLTILLLRAQALTVPIQVGPDNLKTLPYTVTFSRQNRDGLVQWGVTITPKQGKLSPGLLARLHLRDDKRRLATIPLEERRDRGSVTYWFQVTPALLEQASFEFDVLSGKEEKLPDGTTRFTAVPGTLEYQFPLRDFLRLAAEAGG